MAKRADTSPPKAAAPIAGRAKRSKSLPIALKKEPLTTKKGTKAKIKPSPPPTPGKLMPADLFAIFGENLKAARLACGLKQSDVAKQTGLTQQRLSLIEAGHQNLTLKTMMRLAQVVGHEVSAMLIRVPCYPSKFSASKKSKK
jgi:DNA-binding XRE family transcriptional regulator